MSYLVSNCVVSGRSRFLAQSAIVFFPFGCWSHYWPVVFKYVTTTQATVRLSSNRTVAREELHPGYALSSAMRDIYQLLPGVACMSAIVHIFTLQSLSGQEYIPHYARQNISQPHILHRHRQWFNLPLSVVHPDQLIWGFEALVSHRFSFSR